MGQSVPYSKGAFHDPKTKEDLLDRMMRRDFSGDLSDLAEGHNLRMERVRPHVLRLTFGTSGKVYDLTVHKPRPDAPPKKARGDADITARGRGGNQRRPRRAPPAQPGQQEETRTQ